MIAADDFKPYSSRYMCCGSMHVKKGAFILAIVFLVTWLAYMGIVVTINGPGQFTFTVIVLTIIFVVLGIIGLANEMPCFILCYAIYMVIQSVAICMIAIALLAVAAGLAAYTPDMSASIKTAGFILLTYSCLVAAITVWATVLAFKAYRYTQAVRMIYPMGLAGGFVFANAYNVVPLTSYQTGGQMQQVGVSSQQMGAYPQQPMGSPQPVGGPKPTGSPTPRGSERSGSSGRSKGSRWRKHAAGVE